MKIYKVAKVIGTVILLVWVSSAYVRAFTIAGPSMSPTYLLNDIVLSNHLAYDFRLPYTDIVLSKTRDPKRGDLIMYFDIPKNITATKRIIGVPGDTIYMKNNILYINGIEAKQARESRSMFNVVPIENGLGELVLSETIDGEAHLITYTPDIGKLRSFDSIVVSENKYFILGDHRDNSADSRYIGLISRAQIKGKVFHGARSRESYARL